MRLPAATILSLVAFSIAAARGAEPGGPPQIERLKPLHLETRIVDEGRPAATIVVPASGCYDAVAQSIVEELRRATGAAVAVVPDSRAGQLPLSGNVIALGNRSTNRLISALYDRHFTLLDLRYPGGNGYVVRTLHNPLGDGRNVVFVGGSSLAGVQRAAGILLEKLRQARRERSIRLGYLAEIALDGPPLPTGPRDAETWEASAGYGSVGYFGWNSLSKRMALYDMTGDPVHAREFLRLAFPDAQARREIADLDGERIEDKDHPLSGPYHYSAHLMILYWDLIEESPVFSDGERLRVTRAFAEQLNHWIAEGALGRADRVPTMVGSRHGQWAAISLYCLSRYFQTHYPHPTWQKWLETARRHFAPLEQHAWVSGENDNLFWYNTAIAPILTYLVLSGERQPLDNGVLGRLLRGQEILASSRPAHWSLTYAALDFLHKAAWLTGDGRWLYYRDLAGMDLKRFRLGQSFWPDESLKPRPPDDLAGRWSVHPLPAPHWRARASGLPQDESFYFASYRNRTGSGGDFLLLDGFNGASRNPYHTFAILECRLGGYTLLGGYLNQLITRVDGLMEPKIAMDAALKRADVLGGSSLAVAEVPAAAYAVWRRSLVNRTGRYLLVADELTFRQPSPNAEVAFQWEFAQPARSRGSGQVFFPAVKEDGGRSIARWAQLHGSDPLPTTGAGTRSTMTWLGPVAKGQRKTFFWLLGVEPDVKQPTLACCRAGEDSAMLALPEPALAWCHANGADSADLAVLAADHLSAYGAQRVASLVEADRPIDVDWDFRSGEVALASAVPARVRLALGEGRPAIGDKRLSTESGWVTISVAAEKVLVRGARPPGARVEEIRKELASRLDSSAQARKRSPAVTSSGTRVQPAGLRKLGQFASPIVDLCVIDRRVTVHGAESEGDRSMFSANVLGAEMGQSTEKWTSPRPPCERLDRRGSAGAATPQDVEPLVAAAEGKTIHLVDLGGRPHAELTTDGPIRMIRWWPRHRLLLAGCADERVIAFDPAGRRVWTFVSEMDPAVYRAAKTYWFKSAPGHEGIHGLDVGPLVSDDEQVFVGSACTLEILDPAGGLVRRMPLFWGKVSTFRVVEGPAGSKNLLAAFKYNGVNTVAIINSRSLDPNPRGFILTPPGHTYLEGWSAMNRHHLFYEDLEGTGTRDVVSEINGIWNRVCVWSADGKPKHSANFGPGPGIDVRFMRDMDVGDMDGDGKREIAAATMERMVVLLDAQCRKRWATRLSSPANVLAFLRAGHAAVLALGCDDTGVRVLDARGELIRQGSLPGRPTVLCKRPDGETDQCLFGTEQGAVCVLTTKDPASE